MIIRDGAVNLLDYTVRNQRLAPLENNGPPIPEKFLQHIAPPSPERLAAGLLPDEEDVRECWDFWEEPMFNRCVKQHGPLQMGECYGFFPSLGMFEFGTKTKDVDHVKRVSALEHFTMIAQLKPFNLVRTVRGKTVIVREIG